MFSLGVLGESHEDFSRSYFDQTTMMMHIVGLETSDLMRRQEHIMLEERNHG